MKRGTIVLALFVMVLGFASAGLAETGMDRVVRLFETRYAVRHHGVPGLWLAKPFMFGSGVSGLKIAEFDNFQIPPGDGYALQAELQKVLGPDWTPFVETRSNKDHEWSAIYAHQRGSRLQLLIIDSDEDDRVEVLQMEVSGKARDEWITKPVGSAKNNENHGEQSAKK